MRTRGRAPVGHLKRHQLLFDAVGFLLRQFVATSKFAFVKGNEETQAGFDRCSVLIEFVAIEGIADLRAEGIASAQTSGL